MWCRSEVNFSFFRCLATRRMRSSACDTLSRSCARRVLCCAAFPLASALRSTGSAAGCPALFVGFPATMAESDFPRPCIIGYGSSPSRCGPAAARPARRGISRFPHKELPHMPGSSTTPGRPGARDDAPVRVAFRLRNSVGTRDMNLSWLNGWPMRSPTDASPTTSRTATHGSGPMWIATPSSRRTCTDYSLPVSRRTAKDSGHYRGRGASLAAEQPAKA